MSWYRTGTVAVTNGSKTVTGVGTLFTTAVNAGDAFALVDANLNPTGAWYEVESVTNNTTLVLKQSYAGTTGSNNQYCVFNMVGNMTTPSFAQRLATFFASFQSLIDKPTATPTALGIPVADANGDIDSGWLKDASATVKGVVELATSAEVLAGEDTERAVTPKGLSEWSKTPVGAIITYPVDSIPSHCLECNGAVISRATYPELFTAIGTTYGAGDGSTTFNLPDFRDRFLRGAGGVNAAAIGTAQDHMLQDHWHYVDGSATPDGVWNIGKFSIAASSSTPPNERVSSSPATGNHGIETRPVNFAVKFCIVYE